MSMEIPGTLESLESRIRTLLPEQYRYCYEDVQPVSMGSAGLKYDGEGKVAWNRIWGSFCDLAMAGGPPHKGNLLASATAVEVADDQERYEDVAAEICRGIILATGLRGGPSEIPGWISLECVAETSADWLVRAINMENVPAFWRGTKLYLPAGPTYRIEKEIKNVVTAVAKTAHYWLDHTRPAEQREVAELLGRMADTAPLLQPAFPGSVVKPERLLAVKARLSEKVQRATGLRPTTRDYPGWCGFDGPDVETAIWMMRALVASNVLSRREEVTLFVPLDPENDPDGDRAADMLIQVHSLAVTATAPR
ncbi:MAG: hypothetical protein GC160_06420 [Acidobacteria bacterium]|nr:hypothetical protein [Acidobacteriota bacterium]